MEAGLAQPLDVVFKSPLCPLLRSEMVEHPEEQLQATVANAEDLGVTKTAKTRAAARTVCQEQA